MRLFFIALLTFSVSSSAFAESPKGTAGGKCYGNDTCNDGLACLKGKCLEVGKGGGPCKPDGTCDAGACAKMACARPFLRERKEACATETRPAIRSSNASRASASMKGRRKPPCLPPIRPSPLEIGEALALKTKPALLVTSALRIDAGNRARKASVAETRRKPVW